MTEKDSTNGEDTAEKDTRFTFNDLRMIYERTRDEYTHKNNGGNHQPFAPLRRGSVMGRIAAR